MSWYERWSRRQGELAQGVDADLVRYNKKRSRFGFGLLGSAVLLALLMSRIHFGETLRTVTSIIAGAAATAGLIVLAWARQEEISLGRPDPEAPPKIFK